MIPPTASAVVACGVAMTAAGACVPVRGFSPIAEA
jgi:hypothetical protein